MEMSTGVSLLRTAQSLLTGRTIHWHIRSISGILQEQYSGTIWAFMKILFLVSGLLGNSARLPLWGHFRKCDLIFELS